MTWTDVYSKKGEDYLEMVAKGEVPRWDSVTNKWVSNSSSEETITGGTTKQTAIVDPQEDDETEEDLPF
jgi:hypothetical protein